MYFERPLCEPASTNPSLISVQSHVSYGYVGNAVATYVLQRLGCEVIPLHTVMYSSHLGYRGCRGEQVDPRRLRQLIEGLDHIDVLAEQRALLVGFLASPEHGELARELRGRLSHDALVIVDPVLGDHGQLYVSESLVDFYRMMLPGGVDVVVPNLFELGVLTERRCDDLESARRALSSLESTFLDAAPDVIPLCVVKGVPREGDAEHLYIVARRGREERIWRTPRIAQQFAGAGDLFSSCLAAQLVRGVAAGTAIQRTIAMTGRVLEVTHELGRKELALIGAHDAFSPSEAQVLERVQEVE